MADVGHSMTYHRVGKIELEEVHYKDANWIAIHFYDKKGDRSHHFTINVHGGAELPEITITKSEDKE